MHTTIKKQFLLIFVLVLLAGNTQAQTQSLIYQGIAIDFDLEHLAENKKEAYYEEGDYVRVKFTIKDTLTKQGLSGAFPGAWFSRKELIENHDCQHKIESFLTGGILNRADLDLNVYYALTLNEDASINVVDPLFGYGGTKLINRIVLNSPGMDWALTDDQAYLFVSMPKAKQIAVIKTATWEVVKNIDMPGAPVHVKLQGDDAYLWVTYLPMEEKSTGKSGVVAINVAEKEIAKTIPTGVGWHEIAISDDNFRVYVTNGKSNTLSIISTHVMSVINELPIAENPTAIVWSSLAKAAYIGHKSLGEITVIDGKSAEKMTSIAAGIGIEQLAFAPGERYCFIVNPGKDEVSILDAAVNRIIQVADVESQPDQVNFTDGLAYIRHRNNESILMIPLATIGKEGAPVNVMDFPGGQHPAGKTNYPSPAAGIVAAAGESAVLVANPWDKTIYYYMEGAAAPMGSFSNYSREPRALLVVDRSLQEKKQGVYQTIVQLPKAGAYNVGFFMNSPQIVDCFQVQIHSNKGKEKSNAVETLGTIAIDFLNTGTTKSKTPTLEFQLKDRQTGELLTGLEDVKVMVMETTGSWQKRDWASDAKASGTYALDLTLPKTGLYRVFVECNSKGFPMNKSPFYVFEVN